jgi:cell cycle checkpoint control protein RAD9A
MALLNFTLSEEGVAAFRDALICLNKFSDDVSVEARKDSVCGSFTDELHINILLTCQ